MNYDDLSLEYPMESTTLDAPVTLGSLMAAVRAMGEMDNEALLELVSAGKLDKVFPYQINLPEKAPALERWDEVMQQGDSPQPKQGHRSVGLAKQGHRSVGLVHSLVGNSRPVQRVRKLIQQVAESDTDVLILGESGTGKEVVARNLHYQSGRQDRPLVPINCGAIPTNLLESELFGHEKGAFTGAINVHQGCFERAKGGTLFLDEIGDMSMPIQEKLQRVLQERTFEHVGSNKSIHADVRIIAATHRDLEKAIADGTFREDLFNRLNVFPIEMPPLRERAEDVPLLTNELIRRIEHEKRGSVRLTQSATLALCQYSWPGNVRELANLIERLAILYPFGVVDVGDLPDKFQIEGLGGNNTQFDEELLATHAQPISYMDDVEQGLPRNGLDLKEHLSNLEVGFIKQALDDANGVVAQAAKRLGMRRTTLVKKLRKYSPQLVNKSLEK